MPMSATPKTTVQTTPALKPAFAADPTNAFGATTFDTNSPVAVVKAHFPSFAKALSSGNFTAANL